MAFDFTSQKDWRAELLVPNPSTGVDESYGYYNRSENTFGSESTTVDDPEDGTGVPIGGKQTAEAVTLTRPFKRVRDTAIYNRLKPRRGRTTAKVPIWILDDDGVPTSSAPFDTLQCVLTEVRIPEGSAGGGDSSVITIALDVKP